jgi:RimJ/RimL family protein N-acetyltransferase
MIKGNRVQLRPVLRADLADFTRWFNDPEVTQYLGIYLPMTEMAEQPFIESLGTTRLFTNVLFVIEAIDQGDSKPIGNTGLSNINNKDHNAVFGIAIGEKDHWSKGYGTEAAKLIVNYGFEQLNLHRVSSGAIAFNERSIRMHLALGFKEEGRQRDFIFRNGRYNDHVVFGLLRDEWRGLGV